MKIIDIKHKDSLQNAATVLRSGGILIFPTDTVYGIGCLLKEESIKKLYEIKNRPLNQPTAVLMNRNIFDGKRTNELILDYKQEEDFYNGKLTIIDGNENYAIKFPEIILSKEGNIGVRIPKFTFLEELISLTGPIVASSANFKGEIIPESFNEIDIKLMNKADLVIKTDELIGNSASRVYNIVSGEYLR